MSSLHDEIKREIPRLEGWVSAERGCELADLIVANRPKVCVEIGVFGGRSAISQALALEEVGSGKLYAIDPWRVEPALEGENDSNKKWWSENVDLNEIHLNFINSVWRIGVHHHLVPIRALSQDCVALFYGGIDMIFIDGNHSEPSSTRDVVLYLPLVRPGGIIIFDDTDWPSTQKAIAILDHCCELVRDAGNYRIYKKL